VVRIAPQYQLLHCALLERSVRTRGWRPDRETDAARLVYVVIVFSNNKGLRGEAHGMVGGFDLATSSAARVLFPREMMRQWTPRLVSYDGHSPEVWSGNTAN
jgi:hypothetical protein